MSKIICPPFICPKCGNEDVLVHIELTVNTAIYPEQEEPNFEQFEGFEKTYIFVCNVCSHSQDADSMEGLMKKLEGTYRG